MLSRRQLNIGKTIIAVLIGGLLLVVLVIFLWTRPQHINVQVNDRTYNLEVADTTAAREKGLSDRSSLPTQNGMLFEFNRPGPYCFWMKDMRFPLDIIWLDNQKRVVFIEPHLSPQTYPRSYCSDKSARYVVELNAGQAQQAGLKTGTLVNF